MWHAVKVLIFLALDTKNKYAMVRIRYRTGDVTHTGSVLLSFNKVRCKFNCRVGFGFDSHSWNKIDDIRTGHWNLQNALSTQCQETHLIKGGTWRVETRGSGGTLSGRLLLPSAKFYSFAGELYVGDGADHCFKLPSHVLLWELGMLLPFETWRFWIWFLLHLFCALFEAYLLQKFGIFIEKVW